MEGVLVLASLIVLAIPVSIIALFVQISGLKRRVGRLEGELAKAMPLPDAHGRVAARPRPDVASRPDGQTPVPNAAEQPEPDRAPPGIPTPPASPDAGVIAAVSPWDRAVIAASAPITDQNRPLVLRRDRLADLVTWLRLNWIYAVSAASLGLAGIFFVQYGVERGLLPPGLRVLAALAFGAGLIVAGEALRRRHGDEGPTSTAMLPSVFSGAGIVTLFAAVLAARQLYGLIGPGTAFAGHLATAVLAVAIGWFYGPLLVAVGLVGAAASPFVVGGSSASVDWLYGYFALITALGLGVDAVRRWAWVSVLALVLGFGGGVLITWGGGTDPGWALQVIALVILATILPERRLIPQHAGPASLPAALLRGAAGWPPFPARLVLGATLAASIALGVLATGSGATAILALGGLTILALMFLIWAERAEGLADMALWPSAGLVAGILAQGAGEQGLWRDFVAQAIALRPPETAPSLIASILLLFATLVSLAAAYRALRAGPWGLAYGLGAALVAPVAAVLLEIWWQPAAVLGPYSWALHIIALAALMVALTLRFARADAPEMRRAAHTILSALSLIALALFVLTTKTALTLALGVLIVVASALDRRFRLPEMSLFLQAGTAVLGYRLLADPGLDWALEAPLPWVLVSFGATIAAMLAALWLLTPLERPTARAVAESAAAGLAAILANVLITRWLDGPDAYRLGTHWGITLNALPWLIFMLMQLYRARVGGPMQRLRQGLAALGGLSAALGLTVSATVANPLFSWGADQTDALVRGPYVLDTLLLAYGVPGFILLAAAWRLGGLGHRLRLGFAIAGAALALIYAGLEIRRFWHGDWLGAPGVTQPELYTYTLALMLLGACVLYQAIATRSAGLRRLAMAVIGLTVAKVFLIDASGLTGLTRVVSFAGLGLSLAGLAWLNRWAERAGDKDLPAG